MPPRRRQLAGARLPVAQSDQTAPGRLLLDRLAQPGDGLLQASALIGQGRALDQHAGLPGRQPVELGQQLLGAGPVPLGDREADLDRQHLRLPRRQQPGPAQGRAGALQIGGAP